MVSIRADKEMIRLGGSWSESLEDRYVSVDGPRVQQGQSFGALLVDLQTVGLSEYMISDSVGGQVCM